MKHPAALPALLLSVPCLALLALALAALSHPDLYAVLPWAGPLRLEPGDTVPLRVHPEHPDQVALAGF